MASFPHAFVFVRRASLGLAVAVVFASCARGAEEETGLEDGGGLTAPTSGDAALDGTVSTGDEAAPGSGGTTGATTGVTTGDGEDAGDDGSTPDADASTGGASTGATTGGTTTGGTTGAGTTTGGTTGTGTTTGGTTGAGTTTGGTTGAGTTTGGTTGAGTTTGGTTGAPVCSKPTGTTCGFAPQCGCGTGQTCIPTNTASPLTSCLTAGTVDAAGKCGSPGDCKQGLHCVEGVCRAFCSATQACSGTRQGPLCQELDLSKGPIPGGASVCSVQCTLNDPSTCGGSGVGCIVLANSNVDCRKVGSRTQGGSCSADKDCAPAHACVGGLFGSACEKWCTSNATCGTGGTCDKTTRVAKIGGVTYGTCTD